MIRSKGFTLVEALVALLVLSFGLLGVAAMQLKALQSAHAGYQRSIASLAAQDAVELLWSELNMGNSTCPGLSVLDGPEGEDGWDVRWGRFLPGLNPSPIPSPPADNEDCVYELEIKWGEGRFREEESPVFLYTARLPKGA